MPLKREDCVKTIYILAIVVMLGEAIASFARAVFYMVASRNISQTSVVLIGVGAASVLASYAIYTRLVKRKT